MLIFSSKEICSWCSATNGNLLTKAFCIATFFDHSALPSISSTEGSFSGTYHEGKGRGLSAALDTINTCTGASGPRQVARFAWYSKLGPLGESGNTGDIPELSGSSLEVPTFGGLEK